MPPSRKRPASAPAPRRFLNTSGDDAREGIRYYGVARIRIAPVRGDAGTIEVSAEGTVDIDEVGIWWEPLEGTPAGKVRGRKQMLGEWFVSDVFIKTCNIQQFDASSLLFETITNTLHDDKFFKDRAPMLRLWAQPDDYSSKKEVTISFDVEGRSNDKCVLQMVKATHALVAVVLLREMARWICAAGGLHHALGKIETQPPLDLPKTAGGWVKRAALFSILPEVACCTKLDFRCLALCVQYTLRSAAHLGLLNLVDLFTVEADDFMVNLDDLQAIVHKLNTEVFGSLLTFAYDPAGHMTTITISVDREKVAWQTHPTRSTWAKQVPGAPPTRSHKVYEGRRFKYERAPNAWLFSATRRPYTHYEAVEGAASSDD